MNLLRISLAAVLLSCAAGCYMEMYSEPIPIAASYAPGNTHAGIVPPAGVRIAPSTTHPASRPAAAAQATPIIDEQIRDQIVAAARVEMVKRFAIDKDQPLNDYLTLVGSSLTLNTAHPELEYEYVLLKTDQPISAAIWPRTIYISRGSLARMEDESELAGVLAREISNLAEARILKACDLPVPPPAPIIARPASRPTTRPAHLASSPPAMSSARRALVNQHAMEMVDLLVKGHLGAAAEEAADLEGARLAAAARYAPDGFLRLLTRRMPAPAGAGNSGAGWERIKTLDANVRIIAKAFPHADVRLPARFEELVKAKRAQAGP